MKINLLKINHGALVPADEHEQEKLENFANNEVYEIDIVLHKNPTFHSKMFVFFGFCFEHWKATCDLEFMDESGQKEVFRKNLTVVAGYYNKYYNLKGEVRIEAKSLAYAKMEEEEFRQCYHAVVNAALRTIFKGCDEHTEQTLVARFF